jgi:hypothetical protein
MKKFSNEVNLFLDQQQHPLRVEIDQLRTYILGSNENITENIKWNGPNYSFNGEDRISMRIYPPKQIQIIFHRGAKAKVLPTENLIPDANGLLVWKTTDRAVATFKNFQSITVSKIYFQKIISDWIFAAQ